MRAVEVVLEHELPVAVVSVLEDAARDFQLAARRAVDEVVERRLRRPEKLLEARTAVRERREDEVAVERDARRALQSLRQRRLVVTARERNGAQHAGAVVAPAVIRADEALDVSATFGTYHRAAVHAAVDQNLDLAVAHHDDRLASHARREVVAGVLHLALMSEQQPGAAEYALHFELEDL